MSVRSYDINYTTLHPNHCVFPSISILSLLSFSRSCYLQDHQKKMEMPPSQWPAVKSRRTARISVHRLLPILNIDMDALCRDYKYSDSCLLTELQSYNMASGISEDEDPMFKNAPSHEEKPKMEMKRRRTARISVRPPHPLLNIDIDGLCRDYKYSDSCLLTETLSNNMALGNDEDEDEMSKNAPSHEPEKKMRRTARISVRPLLPHIDIDVLCRENCGDQEEHNSSCEEEEIEMPTEQQAAKRRRTARISVCPPPLVLKIDIDVLYRDYKQREAEAFWDIPEEMVTIE